jgi:hypothetical protein
MNRASFCKRRPSGLAVTVLLDICRCTGYVTALRELILADPIRMSWARLADFSECCT